MWFRSRIPCIGFGCRPVQYRQPADVSDVALTFDDGPTPETTPRLLAALDRAGAKATFFLSGPRVAAHPELAMAVIAAGHAVYSHGWEHEPSLVEQPEGALSGVQRTEELLSRMRPLPSPYLIRLPFNTGWNWARMHRAMARFHPDARFACWSVSPRDWTLADDCQSEADLVAHCREAADRIANMPEFPGSIVLLHENPIGVAAPLAPQISDFLVPFVLEHIARRGLRAGLIQLSAA